MYIRCWDIEMTSINYFNQNPPGDSPQVFAPGIISTDGYEFAGNFTPDGKEFFFTRRPTFEGSDNRIYYTVRHNGSWTEPSLAPFAKDVFEMLPYVAPSGDRLFFSSYRTKPDSTKWDGEIWCSDKTKDGWSKAKHFDAPFNKRFTMYISSTTDGTLYFTAKGEEKRGIFKSTNIDGVYQEPQYLPAEINSISPAHPFIAPDESFLIVDAQLKGMGKPELFISFRKRDGNWTKMENMGKTINSTSTEYGASLSPDCRYLFFHRRLHGKGDIYWVNVDIIDNLREKILI